MSPAALKFDRMAIIGLGLLGGSVALAARRAGIVDHVVACGRRQPPLRAARERGVVDEVADLSAAVRAADLVVLATPVSSMTELLRQARPDLTAGALVTDVGSVKATLTDSVPGVLPPGVHYVGAHPMAGSHLRGAEHAREDLFDGSRCIVTPIATTDSGALVRVKAFWEALGAEVVEREPATHDTEVAWMSHLPHVLAFAFAHSLSGAPSTAGELAGPGLRDFTRIARSDAELWGDILSANRQALGEPIRIFGEALKRLADAIEGADTKAQERIIAAAREELAKLGQGST